MPFRTTSRWCWLLAVAASFVIWTEAFAATPKSTNDGGNKPKSTWENCMNWPVLAVPVVNHSPETDWVFGAAMQGYFRLPDQERTSIVQLDGAWSLSRQWYLNASGTLYVGKRSHWILAYNVGWRNYPDTFYELGNTFRHKPDTTYTSRRLRATLQPLYVLPRNWAIGPDLQYLYEETGLCPTISMIGAGVALQFDDRDVVYYPHSGLFFKVVATHFESLNSNWQRMERVQTDLRHYIPLYKELIFAWQVRTEWALGKKTPFPMLPTLGGQDLVRGVRANMFRDDALLALQTELRIPIYRMLRATVFAGVGDVYNLDHWRWATPKVGYGMGLRLTINKAKVNIRADIARNNTDKAWNKWESYSFYLTATEAF